MHAFPSTCALSPILAFPYIFAVPQTWARPLTNAFSDTRAFPDTAALGPIQQVPSWERLCSPSTYPPISPVLTRPNDRNARILWSVKQRCSIVSSMSSNFFVMQGEAKKYHLALYGAKAVIQNHISSANFNEYSKIKNITFLVLAACVPCSAPFWGM